MFELIVPVEQIPYIRTIEGRKFHNGKWQFPDSAHKKLVSLGLLEKSMNQSPLKKNSINYLIIYMTIKK